MVIFNVCWLAHGNNNGSGVNTYGDVPVEELFIIDGDQVPEIPFGEVDPKTGTTAFTQIGGIVAKFGGVIVVQPVLQVALSEPTQVTPLAVKLNVTD